MRAAHELRLVILVIRQWRERHNWCSIPSPIHESVSLHSYRSGKTNRGVGVSSGCFAAVGSIMGHSLASERDGVLHWESMLGAWPFRSKSYGENSVLGKGQFSYGMRP